MLEEMDPCQLFSVHHCTKFYSQLIWKLAQKLLLVSHVLVHIVMQTLSETPVELEFKSELSADSVED